MFLSANCCCFLVCKEQFTRGVFLQCQEKADRVNESNGVRSMLQSLQKVCSIREIGILYHHSTYMICLHIPGDLLDN